jgi:hypothetical protein
MTDAFNQGPNRSRPYLFGLLARIIEADNSKIPATAVQGGTVPTLAQIAHFEMQLRKTGLLDDEETVAVTGCVDEIITPLVR